MSTCQFLLLPNYGDSKTEKIFELIVQCKKARFPNLREFSTLTSAFTGHHTFNVWTREGKPGLLTADSLGRLDRL